MRLLYGGDFLVKCVNVLANLGIIGMWGRRFKDSKIQNSKIQNSKIEFRSVGGLGDEDSKIQDSKFKD